MIERSVGRACRTGVSVVILSLAAATVSAQPQSGGPRKQIVATRIKGATPRIDGKLDDSCWRQAQMVSDFLQKEPNEGSVPRERTEVGFLYDGEALYIGARMYSDNPSALRTFVNRRDNPGSSEQIIISLDTYCDRRTCYDFGVSVAGVRSDRYHSTDNEDNRDVSFTAVWEAQASIDSVGWEAEMRIPFSQLRFNNKDEQVWGVNLNRWIPSRNEDNFWIYIPKNETGWSSRFGDLVGIAGIRPSRRLELLPYAAGDSRVMAHPLNGDPFHDRVDLAARVGGDLKMGFGPNLTLDATVNPDFGQVEADPALVNLSAYETFFSEKRPFFIEGRQLFSDNGPTYFYSRRIGAEPHGDAEGAFVDRPSATTILGAGKLTGRLPSGLSVGVLGALTAEERARVYDTTKKETSRVKIEPYTGYGVLRLQQEFGKEGSTAGVLLTGVGRDVPPGGRLSDLLRRKAIAGLGDWNLRFRGGMYEVGGYAGFSYIGGDPSVMLHTQTSSTHYFQRPDARHVRVDSMRTSLWGYTGQVYGSKNAGQHWLGSGSVSFISPGLDLNDAGFLNSADNIETWTELRYRETRPGPMWQRYNVNLFTYSDWDFGGTRKGAGAELRVEGTSRKWWSPWFEVEANSRGHSISATRGGPLMGTPASGSIGCGISNNFSAKTTYGVETAYARSETGGWEYYVSGSWSTRAGDRWSMSVSPSYDRGLSSRQYVATKPGGPEATYGKRYIFGHIEQSELKAQLRLNYFFTPDLSLEAYAEPFAADGRYFHFGELPSAGSRELRMYGTDGTTIALTDSGYVVTDAGQSFVFSQSDFSRLSFRSNVVLRWEFLPGSTLYVVWQQSRSGSESPGRLVRPSALWHTLRADGDNFFAVKISYWLPAS